MFAWIGQIFGRIGAAISKPKPMPPVPERPKSFKGYTFEGSTYPFAPYKTVPVKLNSYMIEEYLPAMNRIVGDEPKGLKLLITAMAHIEGFHPGSRSYRTKNPGNIGNTDSGANKPAATLEEGILRQVNYINRVVQGKNINYPMGKLKPIAPWYSEEIAKNPKTYGVGDGWVPGYKFVFTGQLDQFVKIYASFPRISNTYLSVLVSFFKQNGLEITPESKLQDIILMT